jgi:hypothetical protein
VPEARAASTNSTSRKQAAEHDRARITVCIRRHGARPARGGERTFREKVSPTARAPQRAHGRLGPFWVGAPRRCLRTRREEPVAAARCARRGQNAPGRGKKVLSRQRGPTAAAAQRGARRRCVRAASRDAPVANQLLVHGGASASDGCAGSSNHDERVAASVACGCRSAPHECAGSRRSYRARPAPAAATRQP